TAGAVRGGAAHGMALAAFATHEGFVADFEERILRLDRRLRLLFEPAIEFLARLRDDVERHERVLPAAVLRALRTIDTRLAGAQHETVPAAGNHVDLAGERRRPEAVDHIARAEDQLDRLVHRHAQLVRKHDSGRVAVRKLVANFPPPLLADDVHADRARRGWGNARFGVDPEAVEHEAHHAARVERGGRAADRDRVGEQQEQRCCRKDQAAADHPGALIRLACRHEHCVHREDHYSDEDDCSADVQNPTELLEQRRTASRRGVKSRLDPFFVHFREYKYAAMSCACASVISIAGIAVSGAIEGASRTKRTSTSGTFGACPATYT